MISDKKEIIREYINDHCIFRAHPNIKYSESFPRGTFVSANPTNISGNTYLFMLKRLMYNHLMMEYVLDIIQKMLPTDDYQFAGLENGSVPLLMALQSRLPEKNIFSIRSTRKSYGVMHYINGVPNDTPVLFVDDLVSSGASMLKAMRISAEELNLDILPTSLCIVNMHNKDMIHSTKLKSIFCKDDFDLKYDKEKYWSQKDFERN